MYVMYVMYLMYFLTQICTGDMDCMILFVSGCTPLPILSENPVTEHPFLVTNPPEGIYPLILPHSEVVKDISLTVPSTLSYSKVVKDISLRKISHLPSGHETYDVYDVYDVSDVCDVCYVCDVPNLHLKILPKYSVRIF